jgi:O-antigen/teichoic acid export membrane protein
VNTLSRALDTGRGLASRAAFENLALRGVTLAAKFAFLVYAGRHLAVSDMAVFGLMSSTVGIAVTVLGVEFYAFSTREILAKGTGERAPLLRDQLVLYVFGYLLLLPAAIPVFVSGVLDWRYAGWFYALAILEHLAQETARLYNTLFRPVFSTLLFFVRSSAWSLVVLALAWRRPELMTVDMIFGAWTAGVAIAVVWGLYELKGLGWRRAWWARPDWAWMRRGLIVAVPFMVSALSYRVIELGNRYIIHFLLTDIAVGVYSFYSTLANVIPAVIGAAVSSIVVPRIVQGYQVGDLDAYRRELRRLTVGTVLLVAAAVPAVFVGVVALQQYLDRPEYASELATCLVLLISTATAAIAQVPAVGLYARHDDWSLLKAVLVGAVTNVVLNLVFVPNFAIMGAAWATTLSYAAMGVYQWDRLRRADAAV